MTSIKCATPATPPSTGFRRALFSTWLSMNLMIPKDQKIKFALWWTLKFLFFSWVFILHYNHNTIFSYPNDVEKKSDTLPSKDMTSVVALVTRKNLKARKTLDGIACRNLIYVYLKFTNPQTRCHLLMIIPRVWYRRYRRANKRITTRVIIIWCTKWQWQC